MRHTISVLVGNEFGGLSRVEPVARELVLIKVNAEAETKPEVLRLVDIFRAKIVDVAPRCYTIEMTGDEEKINALVQLLKPIGIREVVRTGRVAIARGMERNPRKKRRIFAHR